MAEQNKELYKEYLTIYNREIQKMLEVVPKLDTEIITLQNNVSFNTQIYGVKTRWRADLMKTISKIDKLHIEITHIIRQIDFEKDYLQDYIESEPVQTDSEVKHANELLFENLNIHCKVRDLIDKLYTFYDLIGQIKGDLEKFKNICNFGNICNSCKIIFNKESPIRYYEKKLLDKVYENLSIIQDCYHIWSMSSGNLEGISESLHRHIRKEAVATPTPAPGRWETDDATEKSG